jgi:hypothetical protein
MAWRCAHTFDNEGNILSQTEKILRKIEKMSETQFFPIVGLEKGKILARVVRETEPKRTHILTPRKRKKDIVYLTQKPIQFITPNKK